MVIIDPGHGHPDPGAVGRAGNKEADIALAVGFKLKRELGAFGLESRMTRDHSNLAGGLVSGLNNRQLINRSLGIRAKMAAGADLLLSLHCNSYFLGSANGFEVWHNALGKDVSDSVFNSIKAMFTLNRPRKSEFSNDIYILREAQVPAILVEMEFLSNPAQERNLASEDFQDRMATAIAWGVAAVLRPDKLTDIIKIVKNDVLVGSYEAKKGAKVSWREDQKKLYITERPT